MNQIIEQGMKRNTNLRLIVASPTADRIIGHHAFLDRNPRVSAISDKAERIFNKKLLREEIRKIQRDTSTEAPFR